MVEKLEGKNIFFVLSPFLKGEVSAFHGWGILCRTTKSSTTEFIPQGGTGSPLQRRTKKRVN